MTEPRQIAFPTYVVAIAMIAIPLADVFTSLFPWRFLEPRWRFGAVGLISNSLLIPMLGLLVAYLTATVLNHRLTRRIIGGVSFAGLAICLLTLIMFALDALQTRAGVRPEMRLSFTVASAAAALKTIFAAVTFMAIGISAFRGSRGRTAEVKSQGLPLFKVEQPAIDSPKPADTEFGSAKGKNPAERPSKTT
jgi:hypothetical protein